MRPLKQAVYGADFVSQDMSGWDEMLPTIVACDWECAHLPDHGEVWSIPWRLENTQGAVILSVMGVAMPCRFTRSAALVDEKLGCQLRLDWSPSAVPYLGLWVDEGMYNSAPVAALEPSNGYNDSLERAIHNQKVSVLDSGKDATWILRINLEPIST